MPERSRKRPAPTVFAGTDLKIVIYTAAPGSEDETKLRLAQVAGVA